MRLSQLPEGGVQTPPPPQKGTICYGGATEKGRASRMPPPLPQLPTVQVQRGGGPGSLYHPRKQSHTTKGSATCILMWYQGPRTLTPPFPACGTVRGLGCKEFQERPRRCGTRQENLQLGIETEQVQRNKTLICTAAAPGQLTTLGLHPLRGGPVKSWAKLGNGCPQGSAWNSEK